MVYDMTTRSSFNHLATWLTDARNHTNPWYLPVCQRACVRQRRAAPRQRPQSDGGRTRYAARAGLAARAATPLAASGSCGFFSGAASAERGARDGSMRRPLPPALVAASAMLGSRGGLCHVHHRSGRHQTLGDLALAGRHVEACGRPEQRRQMPPRLFCRETWGQIKGRAHARSARGQCWECEVRHH